jgi:hypothetical protein
VLLEFSLAVIAPMIAAPFFDPEFVGQYPVTLRQVCTLLVIAGAFMLAGAAVSGRSRLAAQAAFVAAVTPLIFGWAFSALPFLSLFAFAGVGMTLRAFITNLVTFEVTKLAELALPAAGVILPFIYIAILAWTARTAWRAGS